MDRWEQKQKRDFYRAATVVTAIYNSVRDSKRHPRPFTPADIFPLFQEPRLDDEESAIREFFGSLGIAKMNGTAHGQRN